MKQKTITVIIPDEIINPDGYLNPVIKEQTSNGWIVKQLLRIDTGITILFEKEENQTTRNGTNE